MILVLAGRHIDRLIDMQSIDLNNSFILLLRTFIICASNITKFESFEFQFFSIPGTTEKSQRTALLGIRGNE